MTTSDAERLMRPFGEHVARSPFRIAPERADELNKLVNGQIPWDLVFKHGDTNFVAIPGDPDSDGGNEIVARFAALLSLWAAAAASVTILDAALEARRKGEDSLSSESGTPYDLAVQYLSYSRDLVRNPDAPFPAALKPPGAPDEPTRLTNVFLGATAWILMHEIGHVQLQHQPAVTPDLSMQQEREADQFATKWLFGSESVPAPHVEFRILVIAVAMLWLGLMDQVRRGSVTHPHSSERFGLVRNHVPAGDDSFALECVAYLFKVAFMPHEAIPESDQSSGAFDEVLLAYSLLPR
jgi:hypothetical protein